MKTYQTLQAEIAKLEKQAAALREREIGVVVERIKRAIVEYGLSATDLGLAGQAGVASRKAAGEPAGRRTRPIGTPKFRNPQTGETWTGRGRPPRWIVAAKDRDAFAVASTVTVPTKRGKPSTRVGNQGAPRKTVKSAAAS